MQKMQLLVHLSLSLSGWLHCKGQNSSNRTPLLSRFFFTILYILLECILPAPFCVIMPLNPYQNKEWVAAFTCRSEASWCSSPANVYIPKAMHAIYATTVMFRHFSVSSAIYTFHCLLATYCKQTMQVNKGEMKAKKRSMWKRLSFPKSHRKHKSLVSKPFNLF
jgi:hypothetical protein